MEINIQHIMTSVRLTPHDIAIKHEILDQGDRNRGHFDFVYIGIYIFAEDPILKAIEKVGYRFPDMQSNEAVTVNDTSENISMKSNW